VPYGRDHTNPAGRKLNFSEWLYVPLHPDARLSAEETRVLVAGLEATLGTKDRRRAD
jgi:hypothetical protein